MSEMKERLLSGPGEVKTGPLKVNIIYYNTEVLFLRFYVQGKRKAGKAGKEKEKTSSHLNLTSNI